MKFAVVLAAVFGVFLCARAPCANVFASGDDDSCSNFIFGNNNAVSGNDNAVVGCGNTLYGDLNKLRGFDNLNFGAKSKIQGSNNWIVGVGHNLKGNNIRMFGPNADPYFVKGWSSWNIPSTFK